MSLAPNLVDRPQRWDVPFGPEMTAEEVDWLLQLPPFSQLDSTRFPKSASLRDILRNDCRIVDCHNGDLLVRQGDYGNSAFIILSGAARVVLEELPPAVLGHSVPRQRGFLSALLQLCRNHAVPEVADPVDGPKTVGGQQAGTRGTRIFLQDIPAIVDGMNSVRLAAGELFGELSALGRMPRTATVLSEGESTLLEIRWQGLREIRQWAPEFRAYVDALYRKNALHEQLVAMPLLQHLSQEDLHHVKAQVQLESYGTFDWHTSFKNLAAASEKARLETEPVIVREGDYPNGLIVIRSGFVRISQKYGHSERTVSYLGRGHTYGLAELAHNWRFRDRTVPLQATLRAIGYVDVLLIPTHAAERYILRSMPEAMLPPPVVDDPAEVNQGKSRKPNRPARQPEARSGGAAASGVAPEILEILVEKRLINGSSAMLIDMDRCTHCDDCVRACANAHDNNPRFVRQGPVTGRHMVAHACMHCADPVCMIGCPTGAIHRDLAGGEVVINDATCIGCRACAISCPYDNIRMVERRASDGTLFLDTRTHNPVLLATKCDLCVDQRGGPACERACPHDALRRIDLRDTSELTAWTKR